MSEKKLGWESNREYFKDAEKTVEIRTSVLRLRRRPSSLKNLQVPLDASDARHNRNGGGIGVTPLALVGARVE